MSTPRTPDDGRNERQRQQAAEESARQKQREFDDGTHPAARGGVTSGPARRELPKAEGDERRELLEEKPFDFIERTRPEDRLDPAGGQQTRDNVNPNIPSVTREEIGPATKRVPNPGGIVDPKRLGMEGQAGVAPPEPENKPDQWPSLGLDHTKDAEDQKEEAENRQRQAREGSGGLGETDRLVSINEPPGSRV